MWFFGTISSTTSSHHATTYYVVLLSPVGMWNSCRKVDDTPQISYTVCGVICAGSGQTRRMFATDEFLKGAFFAGAVIGGIITVVLLKLWEKKAAPGNTGAGKNFKKQPTEHDERF